MGIFKKFSTLNSLNFGLDKGSISPVRELRSLTGQAGPSKGGWAAGRATRGLSVITGLKNDVHVHHFWVFANTAGMAYKALSRRENGLFCFKSCFSKGRKRVF